MRGLPVRIDNDQKGSGCTETREPDVVLAQVGLGLPRVSFDVHRSNVWTNVAYGQASGASQPDRRLTAPLRLIAMPADISAETRPGSP